MERPIMPDLPNNTNGGDTVLKFLMGIRLVDHENAFRALIENVAEVPSAPKIRDLVICTIALMISIGGLPWPVAMLTLKGLSQLPDKDLKESVVAVVNGDRLLLPTPEGGLRTISIVTFRDLPESEVEALVSTIYSLDAAWRQATKILS